MSEIIENQVQTETEQIKNQVENDVNKADKKSKVLFIVGCVFLLLGAIATFICLEYIIAHFLSTGEEQIGTALGLVIIIVYFILPSILFSCLACVFHIVAYVKAKKFKILKLVFMIISILLAILSFVNIILINIA